MTIAEFEEQIMIAFYWHLYFPKIPNSGHFKFQFSFLSILSTLQFDQREISLDSTNEAALDKIQFRQDRRDRKQLKSIFSAALREFILFQRLMASETQSGESVRQLKFIADRI